MGYNKIVGRVGMDLTYWIVSFRIFTKYEKNVNMNDVSEMDRIYL